MFFIVLLDAGLIGRMAAFVVFLESSLNVDWTVYYCLIDRSMGSGKAGAGSENTWQVKAEDNHQ